ncbi:MAG: lipid-A-disaccharide synthase, partial [Giesbergeria sp.]
MPSQPRIAMVAGEASGDLLASLLLGGMRGLWPDLQAFGIGGPYMASQGFDAWWPSDRLAVHGYSVELLRRLAELVRIRRQLRARLLAEPPSVFIGVDAPDFNLALETDLRAAGTRTVHFVCPSIWAWRADRVEKICRAADHVLCIFPFEPALLAEHGIAATFVGHPLAGVIPMEPDRRAARAQLGLRDGDAVLAILPGSRSAEVQYITPRFFRAAALIHQAFPAIKMIVPAVPALQNRIEQVARDCGLGNVLQVLAGQSHTALAACDVTLIASG